MPLPQRPTWYRRRFTQFREPPKHWRVAWGEAIAGFFKRFGWAFTILGLCISGISAWEAHRSANSATRVEDRALLAHLFVTTVRNPVTKKLSLSVSNVSQAVARDVRLTCWAPTTQQDENLIITVTGQVAGNLVELPAGQGKIYDMDECSAFAKSVEPATHFHLFTRICYRDQNGQDETRIYMFSVNPKLLGGGDLAIESSDAGIRFRNFSNTFCKESDPHPRHT